jgi:hypothetical protein
MDDVNLLKTKIFYPEKLKKNKYITLCWTIPVPGIQTIFPTNTMYIPV